ncbi:MAG TPA: hypothetical protein VK548_07395 [Candidatus Acidoferrum sp.]|nr:hypothetical protein [Candidatus Acidoferrum sp.]
MKNLVALLTVFLALVSGSPALAQSTGGLGNILNDALGGVLSGKPGNENRSWHGHLVQAKGTTMIFRAEDGKVYQVDMSALDAQSWHSIALGQALTLAAKPGPGPQTLIAARIEPEKPDRAGQLREKRAFLSAQGTVEAVQDSRFNFRTPDGKILWVDASQMPGPAAARVNDQGTLIYERHSPQQVTAVWLDRPETQPSAAVKPSAAGPGEYQRIYGYVHSVGESTLSFKADDGRTLAVDTSRVDAQVRSTLRQGDLVSILGKTTARADQFVAEAIERQARR